MQGRPEGNFLIDYYPSYSGLFIASGGSGHGFKFFPVIGDKITDAIEGKLDSFLSELWAWPKNAVPNFEGTEDGSRSGLKGLLLEEELSKGMPWNHRL
jgi:sarcosine oxidase / L-pipecolate oxidase